MSGQPREREPREDSKAPVPEELPMDPVERFLSAPASKEEEALYQRDPHPESDGLELIIELPGDPYKDGETFALEAFATNWEIRRRTWDLFLPDNEEERSAAQADVRELTQGFVDLANAGTARFRAIQFDPSPNKLP